MSLLLASVVTKSSLTLTKCRSADSCPFRRIAHCVSTTTLSPRFHLTRCTKDTKDLCLFVRGIL